MERKDGLPKSGKRKRRKCKRSKHAFDRQMDEKPEDHLTLLTNLFCRQEAEEAKLKKREEAAEAKRQRELERSKNTEESNTAESKPDSSDDTKDPKSDTDTLPASPTADKASE